MLRITIIFVGGSREVQYFVGQVVAMPAIHSKQLPEPTSETNVRVLSRLMAPETKAVGKARLLPAKAKAKTKVQVKAGPTSVKREVVVDAALAPPPAKAPKLHVVSEPTRCPATTAGPTTPARAKAAPGTDASDAELDAMWKNLAEAKGKSIKALKEQYRRSLPDHKDPRTDSSAAVRAPKGQKMPAEIAEQMASSSDKRPWMKLWLTNEGTWQSAKAYQEQVHEEVDDEGRTRAWLTKRQIWKLFGKDEEIAEEMVNALSKLPCFVRDHPDIPWCKSARQYYALIDESKRESLRSILKQGTRAEADIDMETADKLISRGPRMSMATPSPTAPQQPTFSKAAPSPTEPEEAQEEFDNVKAQKAADIQKQRESAQRNPNVQRQKWLNGVNDLMTKLQAKEKEARGADRIPHGMNVTYADTFKGIYEKAVGIRSWLESKEERSTQALKRKLKDADEMVKAVRKDISAFDGAYRTYHKK